MIYLLLAITLAQSPEVSQSHERRDRENRRTRPFAGGMAFFEAFPANGTGTPKVACSTTAPTGTRGEVLTFTRASSATCTKTATGGLATTGIADGDLVSLSSNVARVEYDSAGTLGLLVEAARTNVMLQSEVLTDAAWVAVNSPIRTANTDVAPDGATTADTIEDDNGGATEGVFQQAANVSTGGWTSSCFLKAGTLTTARITMATDGTGTTTCNVTGLVTTSWTRATCTATVGGSPTYKEMAIYPGAGNGDTGTIKVWGCGAEAGAYATSYIPTTSAAVTRAAEAATFAVSIPTTAGVCTAATLNAPVATAFTAGAGLYAPGLSSGASFASPYLWPYPTGAGTGLSIDGTGSTASATGYNSAFAAGVQNRYITSNNGALLWRVCKDASCTTGVSGTWSSPTYTHVKLSQAAAEGASIWTRVVVDPNWQRCGP